MTLTVVLIVLSGIAMVIAARFLLSPQTIRRFGQAEVDRHALRRARELDELRFKIRHDARRLRRELHEDFGKRES